MSVHAQRAWVLYQQGRPEQAFEEAILALGDTPNDEGMHGVASMCATSIGKREAGRHHALEAVRVAPNSDFAHFALAASYFDGNRYEDALASINEAISLDVADAGYRAFKASVLLSKRQYEAAVASASEGLAIDPEHALSMNVLAQAQAMLGRRGQAAEAVLDALAEGPDDDGTQANTGWVYLRQGDHKRARTHFVEALRINPENEWARNGLAEALKAKNVFYRLLLKWYFWVGSMSERSQWFLIIGLWVLYRLSRGVSESSPSLAPWLLPLQILYIVFCVATWLAEPIFNLVLMLDRQGRYALSARAKRGAVAVGLLLLFGVLNLVLHFTTEIWKETGLIVALTSLVTCAAAHAAFTVEEGWPTRVAKTVATTLVVMLVALFVMPLMLVVWPATGSVIGAIYVPLMWTALIGSIAALWGSNFLAQAEPKY